MDLHDTIRTYRLFSGSYDIVFGPVFHPGRKEAVRIANDRPGQRILEVGVGTGLSLPVFPAGFAGDRHRRLGGDAGQGAPPGRAPAARPCRGAACDGCREPRISGQLFRRRAGALCRLGGARTRRASPPRCAASAFPAGRSSSSTTSPARTRWRASSKSAWRRSPGISAFTPISRSTRSARDSRLSIREVRPSNLFGYWRLLRCVNEKPASNPGCRTDDWAVRRSGAWRRRSAEPARSAQPSASSICPICATASSNPSLPNWRRSISIWPWRLNPRDCKLQEMRSRSVDGLLQGRE